MVNLILKSKRILFITGAGVSTESGIPDFRSSNFSVSRTLESKSLKVEELLSRSFFNGQPKIFWNIYKEIFDLNFIKESNPNSVHNFISYLEKIGKTITVATQNVDSLHIKSGSSKVFEMHGNIKTATCPKCKTIYGINDINKELIPRCEMTNNKGIVCNFILSPDLVLYGDRVLYYDEVIKDGLKSDLLIVMGTSLKVYPVNGIIDEVSLNNPKIKKILLNNEFTSKEDLFDIVEIDNLKNIIENIKEILKMNELKIGGTYEHYKKNDYKVLDRTYKRSDLKLVDLNFYNYFLVRYHEDDKDIKVFNVDGKLYTEFEEEYVIYRNFSVKTTWAREIDDFLSDIEIDGEIKKRFKLLQ